MSVRLSTFFPSPLWMNWVVLPLALLLGGCADGGQLDGFLIPGDDGGLEDDSPGSGGPGGDDDDAAEEDVPAGGSVNILYWGRVPETGAWPDGGGATFNARFWEEISPGVPGEGGIEWNSPEGVDDCAATVWDAADDVTIGGEDAVVEARSAGTMTVSSPSWELELEPEWENGDFQYNLEMNPDFSIDFEQYYEIEASGGSFPGFFAQEHLLVPDPIILLNPSPDDLYDLTGAEPLELEWLGGDPTQDIMLEFHNNPGDEEYNVSIVCTVANDGSFTIPGELVDLFGNEDPIIVGLTQSNSARIVAGGFAVDFLGAVGITAAGTAW